MTKLCVVPQEWVAKEFRLIDPPLPDDLKAAVELAKRNLEIEQKLGRKALRNIGVTTYAFRMLRDALLKAVGEE